MTMQTSPRIRVPAIVVGAIMLVTLAAVSGCGDRTVEAVVERRDITAYATLEGEIVAPPAMDASIVAPYDGIVDRILVTVGKGVNKGDVIMQLAAPQDQAYYSSARQRLQQAQNRLQSSRNEWQTALDAAQGELTNARTAERALRQAARQPEPTDETVAVAELGGAALSAAIERRQMAEQQLVDLQAQMDAALAPQEQRVAIAQQQFADAQAGLKGAMIRTPINGTVLSISGEIGKEARSDPKRPVARVVNLNALTVHAEVDKDLLGFIEDETSATVALTATPETEVPGSVQHLYTKKAGFLRGAEHVVVISFDNEKGVAKPGMKATARVLLGEVEDVLAVPAEAVYEVDNKKAVKVPGGDDWQSRVVEIGLSDGEYTEIRSGLKEGDTVLLNP